MFSDQTVCGTSQIKFVSVQSFVQVLLFRTRKQFFDEQMHFNHWRHLYKMYTSLLFKTNACTSMSELLEGLAKAPTLEDFEFKLNCLIEDYSNPLYTEDLLQCILNVSWFILIFKIFTYNNFQFIRQPFVVIGKVLNT